MAYLFDIIERFRNLTNVDYPVEIPDDFYDEPVGTVTYISELKVNENLQKSLKIFFLDSARKTQLSRFYI